MSDLDVAVAEILATALDLDARLNRLVATSTTPDREVLAEVSCRHEEPDENSTYEIPCGWSGKAVVAIFGDFKEVLWYCPSGHENSEPWADFS
jgi:hypothetical protein